jgi:hypothetical protein
LIAERMLQHPPPGIESGKLGREVLAQYMHTFDELAEQYRKTDEARFRQYAELVVACAKALAPYQSPTYRAIVMTSPQPSAGNGAKVLTKDELAYELEARGLPSTIFGVDVPVLEPEEVAEDGGSA